MQARQACRWERGTSPTPFPLRPLTLFGPLEAYPQPPGRPGALRLRQTHVWSPRRAFGGPTWVLSVSKPTTSC